MNKDIFFDTLDNVLREVRALSNIEAIATQAGCLVQDIQELHESIESLRSDLVDVSEGDWIPESDTREYGYIHESEINCRDNIDLIIDAVADLHCASNDDQERLILAILKNQDSITSATELSALLHKTDIDARAVSVDTLNTVLTILRNPFNADLAEKLQSEIDNIPF